MRKGIAFVLAICLAVSLAACGKGSAVYVQSVAELCGRGGIAVGDRFTCMVVSENVAEIQRDTEKTVQELFVREGDDVKEGQKLFAYDLDELKLTLDKQRLEKEQLESSIESYTDQIAQLERDMQWAGTRDKLQYTVQIQTMQVDLKEAQLNLKTKEAEVKKSEEILKNAAVKSPVTGRIQSINETGTDSEGNETAYITIQQAGSYRIKGTIGELQRGGIMEGDRVRMVSRVDEKQAWTGTVTLVDYENPIKNNNNMYYGGNSGDEMTAASKYPFYVELDSREGLILGQHLYLELDTGDAQQSGLNLSSAFIVVEEDGSAYVWADNGRGKLEKRTVTVGEEDPMMGTRPVLSGLKETDYIAFPDSEICRSGAATTKVMPAPEDGGSESGGEMPADMPMGEMDMDAMDMEAMETVSDEQLEMAAEMLAEGEVG